MATYSLVDGTGLIVNRVDVDDLGEWQVPPGVTPALEPDGEPYAIGGTYIAGVLHAAAAAGRWTAAGTGTDLQCAVRS